MKGTMMKMTDLYFAVAIVLLFAPIIRIAYYTLCYYWIPLGIMHVVAPFYKMEFYYSRKAGVFAIARKKSQHFLQLEIAYDDFVYGSDNILAAFFAGIEAMRESEAADSVKDEKDN